MYAVKYTKVSTIRKELVVIGLMVILALASCQPVRPKSELPVEDDAAAQVMESPTETDESDRNEAETYYNQGVALAESSQFEQAITNFDKAIELNSGDAEAHLNRGLAYFWLAFESGIDVHEIAQAKQDFDKAIELDSGLFEAYYHRGVTYSSIGGNMILFVPVFVEKANEDFEMYLELAQPSLPPQRRELSSHDIASSEVPVETLAKLRELAERLDLSTVIRQ